MLPKSHVSLGCVAGRGEDRGGVLAVSLAGGAAASPFSSRCPPGAGGRGCRGERGHCLSVQPADATPSPDERCFLGRHPPRCAAVAVGGGCPARGRALVRPTRPAATTWLTPRSPAPVTGRIRASGRIWCTRMHQTLPGTPILPDDGAAGAGEDLGGTPAGPANSTAAADPRRRRGDRADRASCPSWPRRTVTSAAALRKSHCGEIPSRPACPVRRLVIEAAFPV